MDYVLVDEIIIPPDRQRREFDPVKIQELAENIQALGLFHPIVVRNDGRTLVSGERRLRAVKHMIFMNMHFSCHGAPVFGGTIPVTKLADLSPEDLYEAELSENVVRLNLSWQEHALAVARLQELRSLQKGSPVSHNDIAEEIHGQRGQYRGQVVRNQIIVAKNLSNPEVAKAKTVDEAMKILKTREQQAEFARVGATLPTEILRAKHRLLVGDFREVDLGSGYAVTITDPPYGIHAEGFTGSGSIAMGAVAGHTYADPAGAEWEDLMVDLAHAIWRVSLDNSHHYLFCDFERFLHLRSLWERVGFRVFRTPFVMCRTSSVRAPWKESGPWKSTEYILYAIKGERVCTKWAPDFIVCRGDENLGHGAQKPVSIYSDLFERSARPGESVLDLCCGTGPLFPAAHALKLIATGVEISPQNAAIAAKRLEGLS